MEINWNIFFILLSVFVLTTSAATSYNLRKPSAQTYGSRSYSQPGYSLFKNPSSRYSGSRRYETRPSSRASHYPGGTLKRTMYTGRYCSFTKTKLVPKKVSNGTETYLKQVVTKCHWTALYCTPRVNYVVSTRLTYKTVMKKIIKEEWKCCPGFEGENCENSCYNCTTMSDINDRVTQLENQMQTGVPSTGTAGNSSVIIRPGSKGDQGDPGPRGTSGEQGLAGERGQAGQAGQNGSKGNLGRPGAAGLVGEKGDVGERGTKGNAGTNGEVGLAGPEGRKGERGFDGVRGLPGSQGEHGLPGDAGKNGENGMKGDTGDLGPLGPEGPRGPEGNLGTAGIKGDSGTKGETGLPGPAGVCGCKGSDEEEEITPSKGTGSMPGGTSACFYEDKYYSEDEIWTSKCKECVCIDGSVTCLTITCPLHDCHYTYRPEGYCCDICCPNQAGPGSASASGDDIYTDDDGTMETIHNEIEDSLMNERYEYEYEINSLPGEGNFDPFGCPIAETSALRFGSSSINKCTLGKDPGPCNGKFQRYYFDKIRGYCASFTFGGCEGNGNSFTTMQECRNDCVEAHSPPQSLGSGAPDTLIEDSKYRDDLPRRCREPKLIGLCRANLARFYYNVKEERCMLFTFGGCSENGNNFVTPWECRDLCGGGDPEFDEVLGSERCSLPKETGTCRGSFERYYYNNETKSCQTFIYGGCNGNQNKFQTEKECAIECSGQEIQSRSTSPTDHCSEPVDQGPCRASLYRFYYDSKSERCSAFVYGGCRGNKNNFKTPEECRRTCGGRLVNYTITIPIVFAPQAVPSAPGAMGPPGPQGQPGLAGSAGPPGPPGPHRLGFPGVRGPPGPAGPPGNDASVEEYRNEIIALRKEVQSLATMVLSHLGEVNKHLDPSKMSEDDMADNFDFFKNADGLQPQDDGEYTDNYGLGGIFSSYDAGDYADHEK